MYSRVSRPAFIAVFVVDSELCSHIFYSFIRPNRLHLVPSLLGHSMSACIRLWLTYVILTHVICQAFPVTD